ncbi:MAG: PIN domain-containing protein [Planctomycetes bacterium]|nr:PIN domain-containing protein [Planctomycetota bacterium]
MTGYLLDTNHASRFLSGDPRLTDRIRAARAGEHSFGISMTVLGELYYAAYASQRRDENLGNLAAFLESSLLWEFDRLAAEEFGRIQAEQKRRGRPIPPSDAQIAAVARLRTLTILSSDAHFASVENLAVEDWLEARP